MGYYSNIRFNTNRDGYQKMLNALKDETKRELFYDNGKPPIYDEKGDSIVFGWDSIRWYIDPTDDVEFVFNNLRDEGVPFEFFRVGEEDGDVECYEDFVAREEGMLERFLEIEIRIVACY